MWHVIISLIYRQACRSYLAAARKQRRSPDNRTQVRTTRILDQEFLKHKF